MVGQNNYLKRLYYWIIKWAQTSYAVGALFALAVAESFFFPIPPDVLLIAMAIARPKKSFFYAGLCTLGSVLGGILGYFIGWQFMVTIGEKIIQFYNLGDKYLEVQHLYQIYDIWAVGIGGFTPLPYKLFTISAGVFKINIFSFILASFVARGLRFFLVGGIFHIWGQKAQIIIERYFNWLATGFATMLILGYFFIKWLF
jgi:membrane protein YqaA with SNARE-associated domain